MRRDDSGASGRILLVEDQAHVAAGHFPVLFFELAAALHDLGYRVTVLTAEGWALQGTESDPPFELLRLGRAASTARRWGRRLGSIRPGRYSQRVSAVICDAVMILAARRVRRRLGGADVIVTNYHVDPYVAAAVAGRGRWLLAQFDSPGAARSGRRRWFAGWPRWNAAPGSLLLWTARRAERRRRRRGGLLRIVANNEPLAARWTRAAPWFEPVAVPFIACRERPETRDPRARLGIDHTDRLALLFGAPHGAKDYDVVFRAFANLPEWQLVVAGAGSVEHYRSWAATNSAGPRPPLLFDGLASSERRDLLHAAADLVVLSYRPGSEFDSGALVGAVTWGLPVVCSAGCYAAAVVDRLGLGELFESGDAPSLMRAVLAAPESLPAAAVARAQEELSAWQMASRHLAALGRTPILNSRVPDEAAEKS